MVISVGEPAVLTVRPWEAIRAPSPQALTMTCWQKTSRPTSHTPSIKGTSTNMSTTPHSTEAVPDRWRTGWRMAIMGFTPLADTGQNMGEMGYPTLDHAAGFCPRFQGKTDCNGDSDWTRAAI